eukprot:CAMPEP_0194268442 /NCGR_PEP_ID=MMETSP0169-20130528/2765_1 /TAXON_ID=218684 /ORGANISM="Corethron pennatum, Strain L29A3" /LENGTH=740 /DNA_ID=CAMNT_0039009677 /DNA_START=48 /DNA_END=2270 /DNA_ORIENTATION=-
MVNQDIEQGRISTRVHSADLRSTRDIGLDRSESRCPSDAEIFDDEICIKQASSTGSDASGSSSGEDQCTHSRTNNHKQNLNVENEPKKEVTFQDIRKQVSLFFKMTMPYYKETREGKWLFGSMLFLCLVSAAFNVVVSYILRDFYSALGSKDVYYYKKYLLRFIYAALIGIPINVSFSFQRSVLALKWRKWTTQRVLSLYYQNKVYYGLENLQRGNAVNDPSSNTRSIDNPDQRIVEDINSFTDTSLYLFLVIVTSTIDFVTFSMILFKIVPKLFYAILLYASFGTFVTYCIGKALVRLNFISLKREADFRYSLVRFRENAESIAFYGGESIESREVSRRLNDLVTNKKDIIVKDRNLETFTTGYQYLVQVLPIMVVAPLYFEGTVLFGVLTQASSAFMRILNDVSLIVTNFQTLAAFSAGIDRLASFLEAIRNTDTSRSPDSHLLERACLIDNSTEDSKVPDPVPAASTESGRLSIGVHISSGAYVGQESDKRRLSLDNLTVFTPDKSRMLIDKLSLDLQNHENLLIVGPSGTGKSSLLRAISGLWNSGSGIVDRPHDRSVLFLPQKPYCPLGNLRDQILYPSILPQADDQHKSKTTIIKSQLTNYDSIRSIQEQFSDGDLLELLKRVGLKSLAKRVGNGDPYKGLYEVKDWGKTLSLGEQQRVAFARILVNRPKLVVLDESTSSLDMAGEKVLYGILSEEAACGNISFVSVGHRPSLVKYHNKKLTLGKKGTFLLEDI